MLDLALNDQVLHRASHVFDRDIGIDAVLVEQVDSLYPKPLQRLFGYLANAIGTAVEPV